MKDLFAHPLALIPVLLLALGIIPVLVFRASKRGRKMQAEAAAVTAARQARRQARGKSKYIGLKIMAVLWFVITVWTWIAVGFGSALVVLIFAMISYGVLSLFVGAMKLGAKYITTDHEADKAIIELARKEGAIK